MYKYRVSAEPPLVKACEMHFPTHVLILFSAQHS